MERKEEKDGTFDFWEAEQKKMMKKNGEMPELIAAPEGSTKISSGISIFSGNLLDLRYGMESVHAPLISWWPNQALGRQDPSNRVKEKKRTRNDRSFSTLPQELVPCVGSDRYLFIWLRLNESYRHLSCGTGNWPHALSCNCGRFTIST